jgi:hypothetical protein
MEPASIRYKNPGAMWGNAIAVKWGADKHPVSLNDGKHQNNNIAVFPTFRQGICAQLDLWRSSPNYKNKPFAHAINTWDGGNDTPAYIRYVKARVPGITESTIMDTEFWKGPMGIPFLKAQAGHEAGRVYPAPDEDWEAARKRVFSGVPTPNTVKKAGGAAGSIVPTTVAIHQAGFSIGTAIAIGAVIAVIGFIIWKYKHLVTETLVHDTPHPALVEPPVPPAGAAS